MNKFIDQCGVGRRSVVQVVQGDEAEAETRDSWGGAGAE